MSVGEGGFEVFNESGFKIGGTDFVNLVLYGKTILITQQFNVLGPGFGGEQFIGGVAVPNNGSVIRFYRSLNNDHFLEQNGMLFSENVGSRFECYSFGPAVVSGGNDGLEFFREVDGVCTFSATQPFLKLIGVFIDPTNVDVPSNGGRYPYTVATPFAEGSRRFACQFSNAHYFYQLVRPVGQSFNSSYNYVRMARLSDGVFSCCYVNKYMWTHGWSHSRVREVPNRSAPQRMLIADVTGL